MRMNVRVGGFLLLTAAAVGVLLGAGRGNVPAATRPAAPASTAPGADFVGTWTTGQATTSLVVTLAPGGKGTFILIQDASWGIHSITWQEMPGGVMVEGIPRLRFWAGRRADEARVEMQPLLKEWTNAEMMRFPTAFFMRRMETESPGVRDPRPLPAGWEAATLPAGWDGDAGKRREVP